MKLVPSTAAHTGDPLMTRSVMRNRMSWNFFLRKGVVLPISNTSAPAWATAVRMARFLPVRHARRTSDRPIRSCAQ
jgi:hypothetical protein